MELVLKGLIGSPALNREVRVLDRGDWKVRSWKPSRLQQTCIFLSIACLFYHLFVFDSLLVSSLALFMDSNLNFMLSKKKTILEMTSKQYLTRYYILCSAHAGVLKITALKREILCESINNLVVRGLSVGKRNKRFDAT